MSQLVSPGSSEGYYALLGLQTSPVSHQLLGQQPQLFSQSQENPQFISNGQQMRFDHHMISANPNSFLSNQQALGYSFNSQPLPLQQQLWIGTQGHIGTLMSHELSPPTVQASGQPLYLIQSAIPPMSQLRIESPTEDSQQQVILVSDSQVRQETINLLEVASNNMVSNGSETMPFLLIPSQDGVNMDMNHMTFQVPQHRANNQHSPHNHSQPLAHMEPQQHLIINSMMMHNDPTQINVHSSALMVKNETGALLGGGADQATLLLVAGQNGSTALVPAVVAADGVTGATTLFLSTGTVLPTTSPETISLQENRAAAPKWANDAALASQALDAYTKRSLAQYTHHAATNTTIANINLLNGSLMISPNETNEQFLVSNSPAGHFP